MMGLEVREVGEAAEADVVVDNQAISRHDCISTLMQIHRAYLRDWDWRPVIVRAHEEIEKTYHTYITRTWWRYLLVWAWPWGRKDRVARYLKKIAHVVAAHDARTQGRWAWWHRLMLWCKGIGDKRKLLRLHGLYARLSTWKDETTLPSMRSIEEGVHLSGLLRYDVLVKILMRLKCLVIHQENMGMMEALYAARSADEVAAMNEKDRWVVGLKDRCEARAIELIESWFSIPNPSSVSVSASVKDYELFGGRDEGTMQGAQRLGINVSEGSADPYDAKRTAAGSQACYVVLTAQDEYFPLLQRLDVIREKLMPRDGEDEGDGEGFEEEWLSKAFSRYHVLSCSYKRYMDQYGVSGHKEGAGDRDEPVLGEVASGEAARHGVMVVLLERYQSRFEMLRVDCEERLARYEAVLLSQLQSFLEAKISQAMDLIASRESLVSAWKGSRWDRWIGIETDEHFGARYDQAVLIPMSIVLESLRRLSGVGSVVMDRAIERFAKEYARLKERGALRSELKLLSDMERAAAAWQGSHGAPLDRLCRQDLSTSEKALQAEVDRVNGLKERLAGSRRRLDELQRQKAAAYTIRPAEVMHNAQRSEAYQGMLDGQYAPLIQKQEEQIQEARSGLENPVLLSKHMKGLSKHWELFSRAREAWSEVQQPLEMNLSCEIKHAYVGNMMVGSYDRNEGLMDEAWLHYVRPLNHFLFYYHDREEKSVIVEGGEEKVLRRPEDEARERSLGTTIRCRRRRTWLVLGRDGFGEVRRLEIDMDALKGPWLKHKKLLKDLSKLWFMRWNDRDVLDVLCYPLLETLSEVFGIALLRLNRSELEGSGLVSGDDPAREAMGGYCPNIYKSYYERVMLPVLKVLGMSERLIRVSRSLVTQAYDDGEVLMPEEGWSLLRKTSWGEGVALPGLSELDACVCDEAIIRDGMSKEELLYAKQLSAWVVYGVELGKFKHALLEKVRYYEARTHTVGEWCEGILGDKDLLSKQRLLKRAYQRLQIALAPDGRHDGLIEGIEDGGLGKASQALYEGQALGDGEARYLKGLEGLDGLVKRMFKKLWDDMKVDTEKYKELLLVMSGDDHLKRYLFEYYISCPDKGLRSGINLSDEDGVFKWGMMLTYRHDMTASGCIRIISSIRGSLRETAQAKEETAQAKEETAVERAARLRLEGELKTLREENKRLQEEMSRRTRGEAEPGAAAHEKVSINGDGEGGPSEAQTAEARERYEALERRRGEGVPLAGDVCGEANDLLARV